MGRWVVIFCGIVLAATVGFVAGYLRWRSDALHALRAEQQLQETRSELTTLQQHTQDLQQRFDQVSKEQERLAQENEILQKQQATEHVVSGQGEELPARPPK